MLEIEEIRKLDKNGMIDITRNMPEHCRDSVLRASRVSIPDTYEDVEKIVCIGMGACYVAGKLLEGLLLDEITIPIFVLNDYNLPKHVDNKTLAFLLSYSGNTEETVSSFMDAIKRRCKIVAVSSGGEVEKICNKYEIPLIKIPEKLTSRGSIVYLLFSMLEVLRKLRITEKIKDMQETIEVLVNLREELDPALPLEKNKAKMIAKSIHGTIPIVYGSGFLGPVALKWKNDFDEMSKNYAFYNVFPEMNHNDIVPFEFRNENLSVIFLRYAEEQPEIKKRIDVTKKLISDKVRCVHEVYAVGKSKLAKMISTIFIGAHVTIFLGILNGVDPMPVKMVDQLTKLRRA